MKFRPCVLKFFFKTPFLCAYMLELPRDTVSNILSSYSRNGLSVSHEIGMYSFFPKYQNGGGYTLKEDIYADAEYGFILRKKGQVLASIWFSIDFNRKTLSVMQIHGKKGEKEELANFRWERMLVNYVMHWARQCDFEEMYIIKSEKQRWFSKVSDEVKKRFHVVYDITAKREGFRQKGEYYFLNLQNLIMK